VNFPIQTENDMIDDIIEKIYNDERISTDDAMRLFAHPNVTELGLLADVVRRRKWPEDTVTYNIGRNINYTNVCWVRCDFCAFYRPPGSDEGYTLPREQIFEKIDELIAVGGDVPIRITSTGIWRPTPGCVDRLSRGRGGRAGLPGRRPRACAH